MLNSPARHKRKEILSFIFILCISLLFPSASPHADVVRRLSDEELLDVIERQSFDYFMMERNAKTGLVRDRAHNFQRGKITAPASIAATGFGLTALGVGVERGWLDRATAREMTLRTLRFFLNMAPQEHGFFYHFLDMETGERDGRSEVSPIDTALFLAGAIFAAEYFDDAEIRDLAEKIYARVDFPWMLHGGRTLALSWSPEGGFNKFRWDHYNESMILYLLAIGSPTHPIPASSWQAMSRRVGSYRNYRVIQMPPLFTHQYSHIWIDFRDKNDGLADYFKNSVNATLANRAFVIDQSSRFSGYGPDSWGLTASDGPFGYRAYGAPPGWATHDGTIAPTGCGGSIVFTPTESITCLRHLYEDLGDELWGLYGFADAFNLDKKWVGQDAIGIDQGTLLLMIENYRSGLVWKVTRRSPVLQKAMAAVGFRPGTMEIPWPDPPKYHASYVPGGLTVDGYLKDWPGDIKAIVLDSSFKEAGEIENDQDLKAEIRFAWNEEALYFSAKVTDQDVFARKTAKNIWQDDLLELYVDPQGDGLFWQDKNDYQFGFRPHVEDEGVETWSWFQGGEDPSQHGTVAARGFVYQTGYVIEGSIRWSYFGVSPSAGHELMVSPAIHDIDRDRSEGKVHWFFRNEQELLRFQLGKVLLEK